MRARTRYMDPGACLEDMLEACRREGVEVRFNSAAASIVSAGGRARGVTLAGGGELAAGTVVNCLGPWFRALNATAGVETSTRMVPVRIQVAPRDGSESYPVHGIHHRCPIT